MNMVRTLLLILFPFLSFAQQKAWWETTIYFQDAKGNMDSVIIGHDKEANGTFNPQIGEENITSPWDSVFEVRMTHYFSFNNGKKPALLSKKIIAANEQGFHPMYQCLYVNETICLFIRAKYFPVIVSWNKTEFQNICRNRTLFVTEPWPFFTVPDWPFFVDSNQIQCMAEEGSITINQLGSDWPSDIYYLYDEILGQGKDTIPMCNIDFAYQGFQYSPCTFVAVDEIQHTSPQWITIYDHAGMVIFDWVKLLSGNLMITDVIGRTIFTGNVNQESKIEIPEEKFERGVYLIHLTDHSGNGFTQQWYHQ